MATKQILFNTEMVRAIIDGRKTVTRRAIRPRYKPDEGGFQVCTNKATGQQWVEKMDWDEGSFDPTRYVSPPYQKGDLLYVRETWNINNLDAENQKLGFIYKASQDIMASFRWVEVSSETFEKYEKEMAESNFDVWRPSIHMPKEAARLWLKVKEVRVEQLQDMRAQDGLNEGVKMRVQDTIDGEPLKRFAEVWDATIKKKELDQYGWEANPWVWVIEFERAS